MHRLKQIVCFLYFLCPGLHGLAQHQQTDFTIETIPGTEYDQIHYCETDSLGRLWFMGAVPKVKFQSREVEFYMAWYDGYNVQKWFMPIEYTGDIDFGIKVYKLNESQWIISDAKMNTPVIFDKYSHQFTPIQLPDGLSNNIMLHAFQGKYFVRGYLGDVRPDSIHNIYQIRSADQMILQPKTEPEQIFHGYTEYDDFIWKTNHQGILKYGKDGQLIKTYQLPELTFPGINSNQLVLYFEDMGFNALTVNAFSAQPGAFKYNRETDTFEVLEPFALDKGRYEKFWDAANNRFNSYSQGGGEYTYILFYKDGTQIDFGAFDEFRAIGEINHIHAIDMREQMWIGSDNGLHKLTFESNFIQHILTGQSTRVIKRVDAETMFFGTEWGDSYLQINGNLQSLNIKNEKINVNRLFEKIDGGYVTNSIYRLFFLDEKMQIKKEVDFVFPEVLVWTKNHSILLGNDFGQLFEYRILDDTLLEIHLPEDIDWILDIEFLEDNTYAIASKSGLYLYNFTSKKLIQINSESTVSLLNRNGEELIVGLNNGQLIEYLIEALQADKYEPKELLKVNAAIATITEDHQQRLWLGTFDGINIYDMRTGALDYISPHLLSHPESNRYSSFFDTTDHTMYIGTVSGVNVIDVNQYQPTQKIFDVYFSRANYFRNNEFSNEDLAGQQKCTFRVPAEERYFKIEFTATDALENRNLKYYYSINDTLDWLNLGGSPEIVMPALSAGNYTFYFKAENSAGIPSENILQAKVKVAAFFYQQPWFQGALIGLLIAFGYYWYRRIKTENIRLDKEVQVRTKELHKTNIQLEAERATIQTQATDLLALDKMKNQFLTNISHELRTPLTLIVSPLDKILKDKNLPEDIKYYLTLMQKNGNILQDRVEELLELSRLESGAVKLSKEIFNIRTIVRQSIDLFKLAAFNKRIKYTHDFDLPLLNVRSDKKRLERIIQNLIGNAIKFTPEGGSVNIHMSLVNDAFEMKVTDSGIGINAEDQGKVFQRFYQVNDQRTNANPGTGIGLAMVHEYVQLMGGEINLQSEINKGSTFSISLPLEVLGDAPLDDGYLDNLSDEPNEAYVVGVPVSTQTTDAEMTVLIVEDNASLRSYIRTLLSQHYQVLTAKDGIEAIEKLEKNTDINMIVSDVMMPRMDGVQLLDYVRKDARLKVLPFIFLTAKANEKFRLQTFRIGVDDYLLKPFSEEALIARIQAVHTNYLNRINARAEVKETQDIATVNHDEDVTPQFIIDLEQLILDSLDHPHFGVEYVADQMQVSRRNLQRILKREIGLTPKAYFKEIQLNRAREIYERGDYENLNDLAQKAGYGTLKYFSRLYQERFGVRL